MIHWKDLSPMIKFMNFDQLNTNIYQGMALLVGRLKREELDLGNLLNEALDLTGFQKIEMKYCSEMKGTPELANVTVNMGNQVIVRYTIMRSGLDEQQIEQIVSLDLTKQILPILVFLLLAEKRERSGLRSIMGLDVFKISRATEEQIKKMKLEAIEITHSGEISDFENDLRQNRKALEETRNFLFMNPKNKPKRNSQGNGKLKNPNEMVGGTQYSESGSELDNIFKRYAEQDKDLERKEKEQRESRESEKIKVEQAKRNIITGGTEGRNLINLIEIDSEEVEKNSQIEENKGQLRSRIIEKETNSLKFTSETNIRNPSKGMRFEKHNRFKRDRMPDWQKRPQNKSPFSQNNEARYRNKKQPIQNENNNLKISNQIEEESVPKSNKFYYLNKNLKSSKIKEFIENEQNPEMKKKLEEMTTKLRAEGKDEHDILLRVSLVSSQGTSGATLQHRKEKKEKTVKRLEDICVKRTNIIRNSKISNYGNL